MPFRLRHQRTLRPITHELSLVSRT